MNYTNINRIIEFNYVNRDIRPKFERTSEEDKEYTQDEFRNDITTEDDLKKALGRKYRKNLGLLIAFVDVYKYIFGREHMKAIALAQTGTLAEIFGSHRNVSYMLKIAKKVDLIKCVDEDYQFNAYNEDMNRAKMYIMNKKVFDLVRDMANKEGICNKNYYRNIKENKEINHVIINSGNIREIQNYGLHINSNLHMRLPYVNDDEITEYIETVKYPQIRDYQKKADEINSRYYVNGDYDLGIRFNTKITRSKGGLISKIGIRATNGIVASKEHDNGKNSNRVWRKEILDGYFGKDNYMEFDVKSSIYRINHFLNFNVWLDNDIDLYKEMYGREFDSKEQRDQYKLFAMKLYFDKSIKKLRHHTVMGRDRTVLNMTDDDLEMTLEEMKKNMTDVIGETYDSEIFLHESCIYMDLCKELLERGFKVVQVYDGFYVNKDNGMTEEAFNELCQVILDNVSMEYKEKYLMNNNEYNDENKEINHVIINSGNIRETRNWMTELLDKGYDMEEILEYAEFMGISDDSQDEPPGYLDGVFDDVNVCM